MQINNTKTRQIEEFKPMSSREVKVYYCGPTVYNYAHIWNLRTFVFEDVVVKTLRFLWYNVKTVMNITDVDDKTIRDSQAAWEKLSDFTQKYTKIFLDDIDKLNITPADDVVPVTTLIPEMVRMIQTMINRKNAYLWDDWSIYFDVKSFKKYWNLAWIDMCNCGLQAWARVDNDEYEKENVADFVLWKSWKESDWDNFWNETFKIDWKEVVLKWRPGWHIECSACNMKYFWAQIDIHMWGTDLVFPHHQNEIAQTESCTKKEFSKYWLHSGHLMVDGKKMSKSANNFYTLNDLEEKYKDTNSSLLYRAIRLSFMNAKYNSQVDFTFDKLESNFNTIKWIDEAIKAVDREIQTTQNFAVVSRDFSEAMQDYIGEYMYHLEDDFNMPEALAVFHNFIKFVNTWVREKLFSLAELSSINDMFRTFNQVLSIIDFDILKQDEISYDIQELFEKRNQAKKDKDFESADKYRDELIEKWYKIVDSREWSYLEKL